MTPQERKYLGRTKKPRVNYKEWFVDAMIGLLIALFLLAIVLVVSATILVITPGAHAEPMQDNAYWCAEIEAGRANVSPEDREEVSAYCNSL